MQCLSTRKTTFKKVVTTFFLSLTSFAHASYQDSNLQEFLKKFNQDTAAVMNQLPAKSGKSSVLKFSALAIANGDYIEAKDWFRKDFCTEVAGVKVCLNELTGRAEINQRFDNPRRLTDNGEILSGENKFLVSLEEMEAKQLMNKRLLVQPWSDDYWSIASGILGKRYGDPLKQSFEGWDEHRNYIEENPINSYISNNLTNLLSPAEKYDLLVGDQNFTFTKGMWSVGDYYYRQHGSVEKWMGICHGWAPAAYMLDRPTKSIQVKAVDDSTEIIFYPSDIKSLGSLLWANLAPASKFVGGRCNEKAPKQDNQNGRILPTYDSEGNNEKCFDTNPGTWHMAVVNQLGVSNRSMIMDATFDYEVWNQPIVSYRYRYFNPQLLAYADGLEGAKVAMSSFSNDKFSRYRSARAVSVVGVEMEVEYIVETSPMQLGLDEEIFDGISRVLYRYDLEMDAKGEIIGGEWYINAHPDFLWTPEQGARAGAQFDNFVDGTWDSGDALPRAWALAARRLSPYQLTESGPKSGTPLPQIVDELFKRSK